MINSLSVPQFIGLLVALFGLDMRAECCLQCIFKWPNGIENAINVQHMYKGTSNYNGTSVSVLVLFAQLHAANILASSAISVAWQKSTFNKSIPLNVILVNGHFELQELFWNLFCGQRFNCLCCCRLLISFTT